MIMKRLLTIVLLSSAAISICFAGGGWPQKKGKGFFKIGQSVIIANKYFSPGGEVVDITTISLYTTSFYGEYGITDRLTGIAYVPFFVRSTLNEVRYEPSGTVVPGDEMNSFGDTDIGLKFGITKDKPVAVSATLMLGLPIGETAGGEQKILQAGDGEFNQLVMIDAGKGFNKWYGNIGVGFNNRTNGFSDEFRYTFEVGYTGSPKLIASLKVNGVNSLYNGDEIPNTNNGVFANNTEYLAFGPELGYKIKDNFGVTASAFFATAAKRILASPNFGAGLYYTL